MLFLCKTKKHLKYTNYFPIDRLPEFILIFHISLMSLFHCAGSIFVARYQILIESLSEIRPQNVYASFSSLSLSLSLSVSLSHPSCHTHTHTHTQTHIYIYIYIYISCVREIYILHYQQIAHLTTTESAVSSNLTGCPTFVMQCFANNARTHICTLIHTLIDDVLYIYIYIYIYMGFFVCVCVYIFL